MPGVRTRDILAGFTDLSLRLEDSLRREKALIESLSSRFAH